MFSDNENLKCIIKKDNLNCVIHSQRFIPETHNLQFSISFFLGKNKTPPAVTSQNIIIRTDDDYANRKSCTLGKVLRYKMYDYYATADVLYFGIGSALTRILLNNGKELRCEAYCTGATGGIELKIFLEHV